MAAVTSAASAAAARIGAALSDAQYFESSMVRVEDIRRQLDSSSTKEKLDAMKRVIALISLGKDASTFFPDVVKNVAAPSLDVKKLVYLYLVHYAEEKQDLALLAINSFQKDLSDHNQHIRALSLRVLSSIRVKVILQVVIHAINKAAKDSSAYVRKAAAHAIGKVCALDPPSKELLLQPLQDLLADRSTEVVPSAVAVFDEVAPYQYNLLHAHYRRYCHSLVTMDPWGQIAVLPVLLRYARVHFCEARRGGRSNDLTLLIESAAPLFSSLNSGVVSATISLYYHLAYPDEFCAFAIKPLMRLVANQIVSAQAVALNIAAAVAARYPSVLIPYVSEFYVSPAHTAPIRLLRMRVLTMICAGAGMEGGIGSKPHVRRALLAELKEYLFRSDKSLAAASARAFGSLATAHPGSTPAIVKVLSSVVRSANNPAVVTESIGVLRRLLQRHPSAQTKALPQLIAMLLSREENNASFKEPAARASVIWLIGEFYEQVQAVATEALRLLARGFVQEAAEVKLQILNLAAKIVAWNEIHGEDPVSVTAPGNVRLKLLEYVVTCAKYDRDYDVRDKARMLQVLFLTEQRSSMLRAACEAFLSRKPTPSSEKHDSSALEECLDPDVILGSLTHVMSGRKLAGFRPLEPWAEIDSDPSLRDSSHNDAIGSTVEREYRGVSSNDYMGSISSTQMGSSLWGGTGASSGLVNSVNGAVPIGNGIGGGNGGIGSTGGLGRLTVGGGISSIGGDGPLGHLRSSSGILGNSSSLGKAAAEYANVDPESFYAEEEAKEDEGEYSSEYETDTDDDDDDEEEDDDEDEASKLRFQASRSEPQYAAPLMPDLLFPETEQKPVQTKPVVSAPSRKPTSEYDLSALLGDVTVSDSSMPSENKAMGSGYTSRKEGQSPWIRIVEGWKVGGLEIDVSFCGSASSASADTTPAVLRVTNRGKLTLNEIQFSTLSGDCFVSKGLLSRLAVGETQEANVEAKFRGKTVGVRFSIEAAGKSIGTAEFKPTAGYVIRPYTGITPGDFLSREKSLKGMFSSESNLTISPPKNSDWMGLSSTMKKRLLENCFLSHVKTAVGGRGTGDNERFSMLFAGYLPAVQVGWDEKRVVLVRIVVKGGGEGMCTCGIWVGCEDVLFSANLMQVCKLAMSSIDQQK
eukprot:GFKZ01013701.1.p1 GENE.GFKZ01013701.1~~GFKZ01013701.1.p1  ORF type:complete len:1184 (-),score=185.93 GFKZ01013701.1:2598-6035(-)